MDSTSRALRAHKISWISVAACVAATWAFSACSSGPAGDVADGDGSKAPGDDVSAPNTDGVGDDDSGAGDDASGPIAVPGTPDAGDRPDAGDAGGPASPSTPGPVAGATEANLKVAFFADTNTGSNFASVLALVKREKADLAIIPGDLSYSTSSSAASDWFRAADAVLDDGTTRIPYFVTRGNHDVDWSTYGAGLKSRLQKWGIPTEHNDPTFGNYSIVYKGLKVVFADDTETNPKRADYVKQRLANDPHLWKICAWHRNQAKSNVGGKGDDMGWPIYENCRAAGAIVAQGHSHTYSRSKTLTADATQTVDSSCKDPFSLCVGPGKHFFFDSSIGGVALRPMEGTSEPHWASTYNAKYGVLFIEFNVDGDPRKAHGYFKNIDGVVIDPPASSGLPYFTITNSN